MEIYHVAFAADWETARAVGEYRISTRGHTLDEIGFIHASDAHQVAPVANTFYRPSDDLVVLVIDTERLRSPVRYDPVPGSPDPFPHIYGPINIDAVVTTPILGLTPDGTFTFVPPLPGPAA